jgi:hypothetical protein
VRGVLSDSSAAQALNRVPPAYFLFAGGVGAEPLGVDRGHEREPAAADDGRGRGHEGGCQTVDGVSWNITEMRILLLAAK